MRIILTLLTVFLVACETPTAPVSPAPLGNYVIVEFTPEGKFKESWEVETFLESDFPRTVTFTSRGRTIILDGSYQIHQFAQ